MSETTKLARSVVDSFAQSHPTDDDLTAIKDVLQDLAKNPTIGTPVPFASGALKDFYAIWTSNHKWRILFRLTKPSMIDVVNIDRETTL